MSRICDGGLSDYAVAAADISEYGGGGVAVGDG